MVVGPGIHESAVYHARRAESWHLVKIYHKNIQIHESAMLSR